MQVKSGSDLADGAMMTLVTSVNSNAFMHPAIKKTPTYKLATFSSELPTHLELQLEKETATVEPYYQNVKNTRRPSRK